MAAITAEIILYILLGAVAGMIYSLKKLFRLEARILEMEKRIMGKLRRRKTKPKKKPKKKKKKKR